MNKKLNFLLVVILLMVTASVGCFTTANPDNADNSKVIWLGDSIFHLTGGIADYLEGDDMAGETFRHYYVSGADMTQGALPIETIREQFDRAMANNSDVNTVLTDGGGNDVLVSNQSLCSSDWRYHEGATMEEAGAALSDECLEFVDEVADAFENLVIDGINMDIKDCIYVCVYYLKGIYTKLDAVSKYSWDFAHLRLQELNRTYRDHGGRLVFVDPRPAFLGKTGLVMLDGVHPTSAGSRIIAELMWDAMKKNCIAQGPDCVPSVPLDDGL